MFPPMRRKNQALPLPRCQEILCRATAGVLAVQAPGGYPYAVPLSFVYDGEALYFHCAVAGQKLEAIRQNEKVSFCVIDKDQVVPKEYTTYFKSVIVFGTAQVIDDPAEKRTALQKLAHRYHPQDASLGETEIQQGFSRVCVVKITPHHISGKQAKELVK